jgi:hypothetical protein
MITARHAQASVLRSLSPKSPKLLFLSRKVGVYTSALLQASGQVELQLSGLKFDQEVKTNLDFIRIS